MSMFCFQCQEAARGTGCSTIGVCGKSETTAQLQDAVMEIARGVAIYGAACISEEDSDHHPMIPVGALTWIKKALFSTITNANFDDSALEKVIYDGLAWRLEIQQICINNNITVPQANEHAAKWCPTTTLEILSENDAIGVLREFNLDPDTSSLRELVTYGLKGFAAYLHHAAELGFEDSECNDFLVRALAHTSNSHLDLSFMTSLAMEVGAHGVKAMAILDQANTVSFGEPRSTQVNLGVGTRPGILVSGHDLSDLAKLLEQSKDSGIDIYTHCEMLPAHAYPLFQSYPHLVGNYGNAWWSQNQEFSSFHGPILFTTNCIVPPPKNASYIDKVFTTGAAGFPGYKHVVTDEAGGKDFSEIIALAHHCLPPQQIEKGCITIGFAHSQIETISSEIIEAINKGYLKKFVVMAGCDGRHSQRSEYTNAANSLPDDSVILTAGCAKFRYNKLDLGSITVDGVCSIPRLLDAGQCNDSFSLVKTAILLKDAFDLDDINDLPIEYNIAWYEQKAIIVLLSLLHLGIKNIKLGPSLPSFLTHGVRKILLKEFGLHSLEPVH